MSAYQKSTNRSGKPKAKQAGNAARGKPRRKSPPANPLLRRFQKFVRRVLKKINSFDKKLFLVAAGLLSLIVVIIALAWLLTNKNALEVYMDETKIGIIKKSDDITPEGLETEAISKLTDQIGANVAVNEKVTLIPIHAGSKDMDSQGYIVSELSKKFTYKVEAAIITVDGVEMAVVKNLSEAENIKTNIMAQYLPEDSDIIDSGFVENVQTLTRFVEKPDIITSDTAYTLLTAQKEAKQTYTAVSGDNLWAIANKIGTTQEKILEMNPDLDPQKPLKIGQELVLTVPTPILSVKTVEKVVLTEVAEAETEYRNNPNERKRYSRVVQQGKDGQKEVTYHITRVNGAVQEKKDVETVYIVNPVPEIIEVGTR